MHLALLVFLTASAAAVHEQPVTPLLPGGRVEVSQPARPARDRQPRPTGTGVVRGVVLADDTAQPVRRAEVRLLVWSPSAMATRPTTRSTLTDTEGRFEFTAVPPGTVTLTAAKSGYFSPEQAGTGSGQPRPQVERRVLADGQTLEPQTVRLLRGGAIVGRIVDEFGEPVEGVDVEVLRRVPTSDGPRWTIAGRGRFGPQATDDTGAFRVWSLPPGRYVVAARPSQFQVASAIGDTLRQGFAPTYFPGTPRLAGAGLVTVAAGRDTPGVTFAVVSAPLATVRGNVLPADGQRSGDVSLSVSRIDKDRLDQFSSGSQVADDGSFEVARLIPGRYRISASDRWTQGPDRSEPGTPRAYGATEVEVDGSDVEGVTITLRPGSVLTGRLITDANGPPPSSAAIQVSLVPFERDLRAPNRQPTTVRSDGSFRFDDVFGKQLVRAFGRARASSPEVPPKGQAATPAADTWFMTAVTLDGRDVTDVPVEFNGRPVELTVTMTTRPAGVSGAVTWAATGNAKPPTVVVFVDDPARWHRESRSVRTTAVGADGRFRIRGLPAGERYLAVAVEGLELLDTRTPAMLESLRSAATPLRIDEGGTHELSLRAVPAPPHR